MKKIYLVDVSSIFFRAFYAIRSLNNTKGMPTNALYGFMAVMTKLLKEHKPDSVVFCFDRPESGFREELYADYKANRTDAPEELIAQFPYLPKIAQALSIPAFEKAGFEADDIIGTLANKCKKQGVEVVIVSGDKDFGQLVEPGVSLFDPAKDVYTDSAGVQAKLGINPIQVIDYLALVGDASDNVPGVSGIGPKGAQKLLNEFESLDGVYKNLDKIKNDRIRELLKTQKDQAYMSQKLVTIRQDVDLDVKLEELKIKAVNRDLLVPLLEELEFKTLLQKLLGDGATSAPATEKSESQVQVKHENLPLRVQTVNSVKAIEKEFSEKTKEVWLDVTNRGLGLQVGGTVFRFEGDSSEFSSWLNEKASKRKLKISGFDIKKMAHELFLEPQSIHELGRDVMLAAYCTGDSAGEFELPELLKKYNIEALPEFALPGERLQKIHHLNFEIDKKLEGAKTLKILEKIEQPLIPILYEMEYHGVKIDSEALQSFSQELLKDSQSLEKEICKLASHEFNVGSPKQLAQVLFERLKLPPLRKTKTGYSTDSDVLESLKTQHPIAEKILEWREITKLKSTYVDALPRLVSEKDERVHTVFNQAVTSTGRLSSTNPNLQNIPIRTARGQKIREAFIAPKGRMLISADYSQVELRILAHITSDKGLIEAFSQDYDIHSATASEVFGVDIKKVTPDHRRAAKAINFGIAYGMSDFGLAESLGITKTEAGEYIAKYFRRFPGVQHYMHEVVEKGKQNGFVETIFGRRRYYPELQSSNGRIRQMAERAAINMPIQGAAADLMKLAMIALHKKLHEKYQGKAMMLIQVHDEMVFEADKDLISEISDAIKTAMEETTKLKVPVKVSIGSGAHWGDAH